MRDTTLLQALLVSRVLGGHGHGVEGLLTEATAEVRAD